MHYFVALQANTILLGFVELTQEKIDTINVINIAGRLDASNSQGLEKSLLDLADTPPALCLLDLSALNYISSAGLRVLLTGAKRFKQTGGRVALCSLHSNVQQVFDISGFTRIFDIHPSRDEAIAALKA